MATAIDVKLVTRAVAIPSCRTESSSAAASPGRRARPVIAMSPPSSARDCSRTERVHHFPAQLSGGEQQRVAVARAFSNAPRILFADEPTGNLDAASGARIIELMVALNRESGATIVLVTHDLALAGRARRIIRLLDGAVVADSGAEPAAEAARAAGGGGGGA